MLITRRSFALSSLAALALPKRALAAGGTFAPEQILSNLERSIWLSTRRGAPKAAYVIAAPWCPFCHQLYDTITAQKPDVDFRFVLMDQRHAAGAMAQAFFSEAEDQVGPVYKDPRGRNPALSPRAGELMDAVNQVTGNAMAQGIGAMSSGAGGSGSVGGFAYPLVVQREADGAITGTLGAWMMLEALTTRTAPEATTPPAPTRYSEYLRAAPEVRRKPRNYSAKAAQAPMFAAPLMDAPQVQWLDKGEGFAIEGVLPFGGEDWVAVRAFTTGEALKWGRLADFYTH